MFSADISSIYTLSRWERIRKSIKKNGKSISSVRFRRRAASEAARRAKIAEKNEERRQNEITFDKWVAKKSTLKKYGKWRKKQEAKKLESAEEKRARRMEKNMRKDAKRKDADAEDFGFEEVENQEPVEAPNKRATNSAKEFNLGVCRPEAGNHRELKEKLKMIGYGFFET